MRAPLLARVVRTFASGFAATVQEKWIDGLANLAAFCWLFLAKPASIWEKLAPFIWLWVLICAWHLIRATRKVWMENLHRPETTHSRSKLSGMLIGFLLLLALLSYGVWRAEVASERTYVYLAPTAELMECQKRAFGQTASIAGLGLDTGKIVGAGNLLWWHVLAHDATNGEGAHTVHHPKCVRLQNFLGLRKSEACARSRCHPLRSVPSAIKSWNG
jgi:hypothetical protein